MRKPAYIVTWWDAYGNPHASEPMDIQKASTLAASMDVEQESCLMLVYIAENANC